MDFVNTLPTLDMFQVVKIRTAQSGADGDGRLLPTGSFTAPQLEMLRHAFELLCTDTTEGQNKGVCREQVAEIMVMAGLELSAPDTMDIITQLVRLPRRAFCDCRALQQWKQIYSSPQYCSVTLKASMFSYICWQLSV